MNFRTNSYNYSTMTFADAVRIMEYLEKILHDEEEDKTNIS